MGSAVRLGPLAAGAARARAGEAAGRTRGSGKGAALRAAAAGKGAGGSIELILVRHGQAQHNVARSLRGVEEYWSWEWENSQLTALGREQAAALAPDLRALAPFDAVLVSPLARAIHTAVLAMPELAQPEGGLRAVAWEDVRETYGAHPCNRRREVGEIRQEWPFLDVGELVPGEDPFWSEEREGDDALAARCVATADRIREEYGGGGRVAIFSHHDFLVQLTSELTGVRGPPPTPLCYRTVQLNPRAAARWQDDRGIGNCEIKRVVLGP